MQNYLNLLNEVLTTGEYKSAARPNMPGTLELFGRTLEFDLQEGFPLLTTKKVSFKNILTELAWFLRGDVNVKFLNDHGCTIWNQDAYRFYKEHGGTLEFDAWLDGVKNSQPDDAFHGYHKLGYCGRIYGYQWRCLRDNDQVSNLLTSLLERPKSRYHILSSWNPEDFVHNIRGEKEDTEAALPACHVYAQFSIRTVGSVRYLDCNVIQRSCDLFLGVPYNIASYALLTHWLADRIYIPTGNLLLPGKLIWFGNSVHIYDNHTEAVKKQLSRVPGDLPKLRRISSTLAVGYSNDLMDNYELVDYYPTPAIPAPLSVGL